MSAWVATAAKDAAHTTSLGNGILHGISAGAVDGFAVGAMLTALCFLVIVAPRVLRRPGPAASLSIWPSFIRRSRAQRDYYAGPTDTHAGDADTFSLSAESEMIFSDEPDAPVSDAPVADAPVSDELASDGPVSDAPLSDGLASDGPVSARSVSDDPESTPEAIDLAPAADFAGHAGIDPYALDPYAASPYAADPSALDPYAASPYAANPSAANPYAANPYAANPYAASPYAANPYAADQYPAEIAAGLDAEAVFDSHEAPVEDLSPTESGRGYRSKHRMTDQESGERRSDGKRGAPRHAAPSTRFGSRMSSRLASFSPVAARG
jgi:hypothetical protein